MDYLELAASLQDQVEYQAGAPMIHVPHEIINQWEDWTFGDPSSWPEVLDRSVYSIEEIEAMQQFHATWDLVPRRTPDPLPPLPETQALTEWHNQRRAAAEALAVFHRRGRLPE
jgi:hypothetical protein